MIEQRIFLFSQMVMVMLLRIARSQKSCHQGNFFQCEILETIQFLNFLSKILLAVSSFLD